MIKILSILLIYTIFIILGSLKSRLFYLKVLDLRIIDKVLL